MDLIIVFLITPVSGESCTVNTDCMTTQCGTGSTVVCQHPEGSGISADNGLCTCADDTEGSKAFFFQLSRFNILSGNLQRPVCIFQSFTSSFHLDRFLKFNMTHFFVRGIFC